MKKMKRIGLLVGLMLLALTAVSCSVLQEPEEASAPIEAVPIEEVAPVEEEAAVEPEAETETEEMEETETEEMEETAESNPITFQIVQAESEARFTMDELLRGEPTTVVGVTDQVAGEILVDFANPAAAQVGTININARTLTTDSDFRNKAIKNEILETDAYEFITFAPTSIAGLPDSVSAGDTFAFEMTGDLTIRDITHEVVFAVNITAASDSRLEGSATTSVARGDYNLVIPSVPSVAEVDEDVVVELDFVATP